MNNLIVLLKKYIKFNLWGPVSLLVQIISSHIFINFLNIEKHIGFILAIFITININYFVLSIMVFKSKKSTKNYLQFISTNFLSRIVDFSLFFFLNYLVEPPLSIVFSTICGATFRFLIYNNFVFNEELK